MDKQGGECAIIKTIFKMAKNKDNVNNESSEIFRERIGDVSIRMMLDIRNRNKKESGDDTFPLCIRFVLNGKRSYYRLGESFSEKELRAIRLSTGYGEKSVDGKETRFQIKMRLNSTFMKYVETVRQLSETGQLSLSRIMTALTGKSDVSSLIDVWEGYIENKVKIGKIGTADNYRNALRSFLKITNFKKTDGFAIDSNLVRKWDEGMRKRGNSNTTVGINLRCLRAIINECVREGFMQPKDKMFGADVNRADKIKIPVGSSRKDHFIDVEKMTEIYIHWLDQSFNLPLYKQGEKNPAYAVKDSKSLDEVYQSVAMFLAQYLCCGCNLADLALLKYDDYYFVSQEKGFRFIRKKSEDTANEGEGTEVIIPIIEPLRNILKRYAAEPQKDVYVFPFILGESILAEIDKADEVVGKLSVAIKERIKQENHNIGDHMKKIAKSLGWTESLSSTWARHSFATNMFTCDVPKHYISDAMGHTIENRGDITDRYISAYTIEKRMEYNYKLLGIDYAIDKDDLEEELTARQELYSMMDDFTEEELKTALLRLQSDKLRKMKGK